MATIEQKQSSEFISLGNSTILIRLDQIRYVRLLEKCVYVVYIDGTDRKLEYENIPKAEQDYAKLFNRLTGVPFKV